MSKIPVSKRKSVGLLGLLLFSAVNVVLFQNCSPGFGNGTSVSANSTLSENPPTDLPDDTSPDPKNPESTPRPGATPTPVPTASPIPGATPAPPTPTPVPSPAPTPTSKVAVFLATGYMARTVFSCDDGVTWIHDLSFNDAARCFENGLDCDHSPYSAYGTSLEYGDGYFYVAYGWGYNGPLKRSTDGVNWQTIRSDSYAAGLGFAKGRLSALRTEGILSSSDRGTSFVKASMNFNIDNSMANPLLTTVGDKVFAVGRPQGAIDLAISLDGGQTFMSVPSFNGDWGGSFVEGNGVIVSLAKESMAGVTARSTDGGATWTSRKIAGISGKWRANIVFNGTHFVGWADDRRYISTDGLTWTSTALASNYWQGAASYNPKTGTYVVIYGDYFGNYAEQRAFRSKDGITWSQLDSAHFKGGHPIKRIVLGEMEMSACR